ncbi:hypothetical protein LTR08_003486 [Meristemomyces frigidus]|nr:hypothetical protein LTR08_003486 [Meristemomyces frigidus]
MEVFQISSELSAQETSGADLNTAPSGPPPLCLVPQTEATEPLTMAIAQPGFLRLPVELQKEVVEYITSKADLKSLCLTCKEVQFVATPQLYQTMVLHTGQIHSRLTEALHGDNAGLRHVRTLLVREDGQAYDHKTHGAALCHLIHALPKHSLTLFELDTYRPTSMEIIYLLHTRQHRLTNYQLQRLPNVSQARIMTDEADLRSITCLQLYIHSFPSCRRGNHLLQNVPSLKRLGISVAGKYARDHDAFDEVFIEKQSAFLRMLLGTADDGHDYNFAQLQHLTLRGWNFENSDDSRLQHVFASTSELHLVDCAGIYVLLAEHDLSRLVSLSIVRADGTDAEMDHTVQLLESITGLQELQHSATIRRLRVDDYNDNPFYTIDGYYDRSPELLTELCNGCDKLEQLAMSMPEPSPDLWDEAHGLNVLLECLKPLKALKILRLFSHSRMHGIKPNPWEHVRGVTALQPLCTSREADFQQIANRILGALCDSCPNLNALVIDARRTDQDCSDQDVRQFGFLRARQTDICGRVTAVGVPIKAHLIKHYEPCSEILEDHWGPVR